MLKEINFYTDLQFGHKKENASIKTHPRDIAKFDASTQYSRKSSSLSQSQFGKSSILISDSQSLH